MHRTGKECSNPSKAVAGVVKINPVTDERAVVAQAIIQVCNSRDPTVTGMALHASATTKCMLKKARRNEDMTRKKKRSRTCTSSMYTSTYGQITKDFDCSQIVATLGLSLFVIGLGIGPMLLGPLSETMLVARFLDGVAGSAFLSVAGGTIGDMFDRSELQAPMMIYSASPFLGPPVGPVVGDFINYYTSWQVEPRATIQLRTETGNPSWQAPIEKLDRSITQTIVQSVYRPFLLLILEPMCLNLCLFSAVLLGVLYLFFGAFQVVFEENHDFNLWQVGLTFSGLLVGIIIAVGSDPLWHRNYVRLVRKREADGGEKGGTEPEYRLPPAIAGGILVPIGLFW
ncbi:MAG: hypothetical protein Q9219_000917 [cf. Caloplaca sp. 3 TL-2023]